MNSSHTRLCPRPLENHSACPAPRVYEWAWAGQCAPGKAGSRRYETFSVGCFQWLPRSDGGLKKGKVVERFQGRTDAPDEVYARAAAWCAERNDAFVRLEEVVTQVPWSCRACAHAYMEPDSDLVCGHPDSGTMGLFVGNGHGPDAPGGHCGPERTKFKQHPLRTPEGNLICRGSQKELGRD